MKLRGSVALLAPIAISIHVLVSLSRAADPLPPELIRYELTIVDVGGGGLTSTTLWAINDQGHYVGSMALTASNATSAVIWRGSGAEFLPKGSYVEARARGINNADRVVGDAAPSCVFTFCSDAVEWEFDGDAWSMTFLRDESRADAIGNSGVVAGSECALEGLFGGCDEWAGFAILPAGSVVDIGTFGGASSQALGVNDLIIGTKPTIVGSAETAAGVNHAFVMSDETGGLAIDLGTLPPLAKGDVPESSAVDVNNADPPLIVGSSRRGSGANGEPVVWYKSGEGWQVRSLGTLGGNTLGAASAVNDHDHVVGSAVAGLSEPHAFIAYDPVNGGMFDLNNLIPCDALAVLQGTADINNVGQIVGSAVVSGLVRGFLLDPFPAGDCDRDGLTTLDDAKSFMICVDGPDAAVDPSCACFDFDCSQSIDLKDVAVFQQSFGLTIP